MPEYPEVKVDCYFVKLRARRQRLKKNETRTDDYLRFNELPALTLTEGGEEATAAEKFTDWFRKYVESVDGGFVLNSRNDLAFNLPLAELTFHSELQQVSGTVRGGRGGISKAVTLKDKANEEPEFHITTEHVDYNDFAYLIHLPEGGKIGVIMVSGMSKFSIGETFMSHFKRHIKDTYDLVAEIDRFVPREIIDEMKEEATIEAVTLTRYDLPADAAESTLGLGFEARGLDVEVKIKGTGGISGKIKEMLRRVREGGPDRPVFFTSSILDELGLRENERRVSLTFKRDGKISTARSDNNFDLKPYFYVPTERINYDATTKLPDLQSVKTYMLNHLLPMVQTDLQR